MYIHIHNHTLNLQSTTRTVLSESTPTLLVALQVMMPKILFLVTIDSVRLLVTLFVAASVASVLFSSGKVIISRHQEMVGTGTPVAVHITTAELPSDTITVGFGEMVAMGATANGE